MGSTIIFHDFQASYLHTLRSGGINENRIIIYRKLMIDIYIYIFKRSLFAGISLEHIYFTKAGSTDPDSDGKSLPVGS